MSKWEDLKKAIKNPPPERLAKTEYQSHFFHILGVLFVCSILIWKGYWYVIFALIFTIGISYSQGMTAYNKYKLIKTAVGERYVKAEDDPSFTRRRSRIIEEEIGPWINYLTILISIFSSWWIVQPLHTPWYIDCLFVVVSIGIYIIITYAFVYQIAKRIKLKKCKEVKNGEERKTE